MKPQTTVTDLGFCSKCGKDAAWNTPHVTPEGKVLCNRCAYKSDELLKGIEQYRDAEGKPIPSLSKEYTMQGITIWMGDESFSAWYNSGGTAFPWTEQERNMIKRLIVEFGYDSAAFTTIKYIQGILMQDKFRCTGCKKDFPVEEEAGRPLFAGRVCKACWGEHYKLLQEERRTGQVCRMCGRPWSDCAC